MATPPTRTLRERPHLVQLRRQAKELRAAFVAGDADALAEVTAHYRDPDPAHFALHDAQLVLARSYGFDSWRKLKAFVDGVTVTRLAEMVRADDLVQVRALLEARPELVHMELANDDEHRALHYAVLGRSPEMVRLLMQYGADARKGIYPHREATSALTIATERGYDELVAIILEEEECRRESFQEGAGPDATATQSADDLVEAIRRGDDARAITILEKDTALIDARHRDGWTPLHVAAATLNERMVQRLLEGGTDVTQRGKRGQTALDLAATARRLGPGGKQRFAKVAAMLRRRGAQLSAASAVALGEADWLRARHAEGVLASPALVDVFDSPKGLLTLAVRHDRPEMVTLLLDLGFDPDEPLRVDGLEQIEYSWAGPLWHCAVDGNHAMAELLLRRGADPNAQVYAGGSAVFQAYGQRDAAMVTLLLQHGGRADAATLGHYRQTELARQMLADADAGLLPEAMPAGQALVEELLWGAACGGDPEIVQMALERVDWPREDPRWYRILEQPLRFWNHMPSFWANPDLDRGTYVICFRLVLERCDANVVGRSAFGLTILHDLAASREHVTAQERVGFATMLLDAGARMDVRDDLLQSTPLGWACRWGRVELVRLLLGRGADPMEANAEPWATPRAWADKKGHEAVLALLREHGSFRLGL